MVLRSLSWNIAAVNNNPFEYFIHYTSSKEYSSLMRAVETFIQAPAHADVPVNSVFTDSMFAELKQKMEGEKWDGVEEAEAYWHGNLKGRAIVSQFLKDKELGNKRLTSMPDRVTNTINVVQGSVYRPTVISCSTMDMTSTHSWWEAWKSFMFNEPIEVMGKDGAITQTKPCCLLPKIKKSKYPAITEEEEAISIPLQAMAMAVFDAILVHMLNQVSTDGTWQNIKNNIIKHGVPHCIWSFQPWSALLIILEIRLVLPRRSIHHSS